MKLKVARVVREGDIEITEEAGAGTLLVEAAMLPRSPRNPHRPFLNPHPLSSLRRKHQARPEEAVAGAEAAVGVVVREAGEPRQSLAAGLSLAPAGRLVGT